MIPLPSLANGEYHCARMGCKKSATMYVLDIATCDDHYDYFIALVKKAKEERLAAHMRLIERIAEAKLHQFRAEQAIKRALGEEE